MSDLPDDLPPQLARRPLGSGDEWVTGPDGQRFWGKHGSAGLLVHDRQRGVLLQLRATWSHFGGTWGLPGGARHEQESAVQAALREADEEAGVPPHRLRLQFSSLLDLGFWSYTTVAARAMKPFDPVIGDAESADLRWVPVDEVASLPLHPGFAASWPGLANDLSRPVTVIVDTANVIGSRPNQWWRDRVGATEAFAAALQAAVAHGVPGSALGLGRERWWPQLVLVVEGRATAAAIGADETPLGATGALTFVRAAADGDQAIVDAVREQHTIAGSPAPGGPGLPAVFVVTADRELSDRVQRLGAQLLKPRWLWQLIDAQAGS